MNIPTRDTLPLFSWAGTDKAKDCIATCQNVSQPCSFDWGSSLNFTALFPVQDWTKQRTASPRTVHGSQGPRPWSSVSVRAPSRSISPRWRSIRFRLACRTYDAPPCGVRVVTLMAVNSISSGPPHIRPMGVHRTRGEPGEIKKNTQPKYITALFLRAGTAGVDRPQGAPTPHGRREVGHPGHNVFHPFVPN